MRSTVNTASESVKTSRSIAPNFNITPGHVNTSTSGNVITLTNIPAAVKSKSNAIDIDDYLAQFDNDPESQELLSDGRKWLASDYFSNEVSLRSLRLSHGLSQSQLAKLVPTSQARISAIESGTEDVRLSTIVGLANALSLDAEIILKALVRKE